jgi:ADP-ribose pyrophosphatase YjhB (NUDIX family)
MMKLYWRIFKPKTTGVKVFIKYKNKVLFVQNSYGQKCWTLPGGGVKRGESFEDAAKREIKEEVGLELKHIIDKGSFLYEGEGKRDTIHIFLSEVESDDITIDNFEIQNASWEDIHSLTLSESPIAKKCFEIAGYKI